MAQLNTTQREEVRAQLAEEFSAELEEVPVDKAGMTAIVDAADVDLETGEANTLAALTGTASTWLTANPTLLRRFIQRTQDKRREVL